MKVIGNLILISLIPLALLISFKLARGYCMAIDEILTDISNAMRGKYKSKYKDELKKGK